MVVVSASFVNFRDRPVLFVWMFHGVGVDIERRSVKNHQPDNDNGKGPIRLYKHLQDINMCRHRLTW
eukprot:scaffold574_cov190-Amphora_coffeaeformis.AAC.19